jgi:hypothetical protein
MSEAQTLLRRVRLMTWIFIFGLVISGATAIPLQAELNWLAKWFDPATGIGHWLNAVRLALDDTYAKYPFIAYGTDWLAFGHFVIAIVFIGALRDPVRNLWLFDFGLIACVLVIPYAFFLGQLRGIPMGWRLIDCSFGVFGVLPLWLCRKWARELAASPNPDARLR